MTPPRHGERSEATQGQARGRLGCFASLAMTAVLGLAAAPALAADAARGRAIVADRTRGLCLLCHAAPMPEERFQGDLAPTLAGAGSRWSADELRLRLLDARRFNPDTIMPPYGPAEGLARVATAWRGRTLLAGDDIDDVVAYLVTLKEAP